MLIELVERLFASVFSLKNYKTRALIHLTCYFLCLTLHSNIDASYVLFDNKGDEYSTCRMGEQIFSV